MQFVSDIDRLEQMIETCFAVDNHIKVFDNKGNTAELRYRVYKINGRIEHKTLGQCKHILIGLIKKYRLFSFNGQNYYYQKSKRELRNL